MHYLRKQVSELKNDEVLRLYGVAIAFLHVLSAYWFLDSGAQQLVAENSEPICWPIFDTCDVLRVFSADVLHNVFFAYGVVAIITMALFVQPRLVDVAYSLAIGITIFKLIIVLIDFRLRLNQHYMGFAISAVYLLVPRKRVAIPWMIVLFYVWAGILKLDWAWISGDALIGRLPLFKGPMLMVACTYVVILELFFVWGLLAWRMLFWFSFLQLIAFHVISWWVVGYFYPLLMFTILSYFLIERACGTMRIALQGRVPIGMICIFSLLQLIPYSLPGDFRVTGEGRMLSLHMFDAPHRCEIYLGLSTTNDQCVAEEFRLTTTYRISCDPAVYFKRAQRICQKGEWLHQSFTDFDLVMLEGRKKNLLVNIENFCSKNLTYHAFWHNDWIAIY